MPSQIIQKSVKSLVHRCQWIIPNKTRQASMPWLQRSFNCVTRNFNCLPFVAWEQAVKRVSARTFLSFTRGKKSMSWIARAGEWVWKRSTSHCLCQTPNLSSIRLKSSRGRRNTRPAALIMMAWTVFKMIRTPILDSIQSSFIWRTGSRERSEVILSIYEIFSHFLSFFPIIYFFLVWKQLFSTLQIPQCYLYF